jgi:hypothetical protein
MGVNLYIRTTSDTLGPLVIDGDSPLLQGPLCNMVLRCSEYMRTSVRLMEDIEKKRKDMHLLMRFTRTKKLTRLY